METTYKHILITMAVLALSLPVLSARPTDAPASPAQTDEQKENQLIQDLASPDADKVQDALGHLEDMFHENLNVSNAIPVIRTLLADTREPVRRKAARVLGVFHVQLTDTELKEVCAQLKASDWREVQSGLKALRDFNVPSTVPDILPCLKNSNPYVVRDACRTLAVVANKDVIPSIQPLLKSPDKAVQKDAQDAIAILKEK